MSLHLTASCKRASLFIYCSGPTVKMLALQNEMLRQLFVGLGMVSLWNIESKCKGAQFVGKIAISVAHHSKFYSL